jgi:uncharacterized protein YoaH (UPF0181 family)
MARAAVIGPEIHAKVTELVASGMSKSDAFKQVAKERKSSEGTVSANFYRVARQGRKRTPTRGRPAASKRSATERGMYAAQRGRGNGRTSNDRDLASLAKQISDLTQELVRRVEDRDRQIRELLG